ncbi:MAG: alpha/beta hydrolase [Brevefilum sp.]|nr:alpha/beta hydrolase [Brevefilum sp.]
MKREIIGKAWMIMKWLGLGILLILLLVILGSFINHRIRLAQEKSAFPPLGKMVSVNEHQIHVYTEGTGDLPLVFIAGSGTSSPTLNFKPLYAQLSDEYQIVVIERSGYGWSDIGSTPRDIDTLLFENRKALELAEIQGPYVLFAHSMGVLEAMAWANLYPEEVVAIIGLDPAVPETYQYLQKPPLIMINLLAFLARTGITRLSPDVCNESLSIHKDYLTAGEEEIFCALFYRSTLTKNMLNENKEVENNALRVEALGIPDVPLLFFISDGIELGMENWRSLLISYINSAPQGQYRTFDVGHYVHNHEPAQISAESHIFIQEVIKGLH